MEKIMPLNEWPSGDLARWEAAKAGSGPDGQDNPAFRWSSAQCKKVEYGYGRFLGWYLSHTGSLPASKGYAKLDEARTTLFLNALMSDVQPLTVLTYYQGVVGFIRAVEPARYVEWMQARINKLKARAIPVRNKMPHLRGSEELVRLGYEMMRSARKAIEHSNDNPLSSADRYQTGLMIAMLAMVPLRMRNFGNIEIGRSLVSSRRGYALEFRPDETKTGIPIEGPLPHELIEPLEYFLKGPRRLLLRAVSPGPRIKYLWVTPQGTRKNNPSIRHSIMTATEAAFGHKVWPHLFRDCVATTVAENGQGDWGIIAHLLSHRSLATARKHYIHANLRAAMGELSRIVEAQLSAPEPPDDEARVVDAALR